MWALLCRIANAGVVVLLEMTMHVAIKQRGSQRTGDTGISLRINLSPTTRKSAMRKATINPIQEQQKVSKNGIVTNGRQGWTAAHSLPAPSAQS
jgi:uncharacterized protein YdgA (DUF945 family)